MRRDVCPIISIIRKIPTQPQPTQATAAAAIAAHKNARSLCNAYKHTHVIESIIFYILHLRCWGAELLVACGVCTRSQPCARAVLKTIAIIASQRACAFAHIVHRIVLPAAYKYLIIDTTRACARERDGHNARCLADKRVHSRLSAAGAAAALNSYL